MPLVSILVLVIPLYSLSLGEQQESVLIPPTESMQTLAKDLFTIANEYSSTMWACEDLHKVIRKIRALQRPSDRAVRKGDRHDSIPAFTKWATEFVRLDGVELMPIAGKGLGLIATRDLPKGHKVFQALTNHTMSRDNSMPILHDCLGGEIVYDNVMDESNWNDELPVALRLVSEANNPNTIFTTFINAVPTITEQSHVFLYSPEESRILRGSEGFGVSVLYQMEAATMYATVYNQMLQHPDECAKIFLTPDTFSYDVFTWALALAHTHTVTDPDGNMVFVPYFDMINHSFEPPFLEFDTITEGDTGTFVAPLAQEAKQGDEIYLNYQNRENSLYDYFIRWNIIAENVLVELPISLYPFDPHFEQAKEELSKTGDEARRLIYLKSPGHRVPLDKKAFQLLSIMASGKTTEVSDQQLWHKSWNFLARKILSRLERYEQRLEEHEAMLRRTEEDPNYGFSHLAQDALRFIIEEQRIYSELYRVAKQLASENASEFQDIQIHQKEDDDVGGHDDDLGFDETHNRDADDEEALDPDDGNSEINIGDSFDAPDGVLASELKQEL